jgi:uncharacterized integral membrane protein
MRFIKQLSWLLRALIFVMIFGFALMNTDMVKLRFFLGQTWEAPLIFVFGAAIGVLACLSRLLGQRREIQRLQRALRAGADRATPPQA